jgi:hypothetical protein
VAERVAEGVAEEEGGGGWRRAWRRRAVQRWRQAVPYACMVEEGWVRAEAG